MINMNEMSAISCIYVYICADEIKNVKLIPRLFYLVGGDLSNFVRAGFSEFAYVLLNLNALFQNKRILKMSRSRIYSTKC